MPDQDAIPVQIPTRADVIARHGEGGGQVAAVFPIHYPRALLRAFGVLPVEVWGPPGRVTTEGDAHLQAYTCSIVRCALSFLLSGGLDGVSMLLVPHGCDSLQGLGSLLLDLARPEMPVVPLYIPRNDSSGGHRYLAAELSAVAKRLEEITGAKPTGAELRQALAREERTDAVLRQLWQSRPSLPLSNRDFYRLVRAREYVPAEALAPLLTSHLERRSDAPPTGVPVILSGIVPEPMDVLDVLSDANALVVADDMACCGRRLYPPGQSDEPYARMAESLLGAPPDPTRNSAVARRVEHLTALARATGARAVVFYVIKFCEPELFYLPQLRAALEQAGVLSVTVEVDLADRLPQQATTRIEALLETLA